MSRSCPHINRKKFSVLCITFGIWHVLISEGNKKQPITKVRKREMKRILSCILILATIFALAQPALAAQPNEITPQYVNARQAEVYLSINSSGGATVTVTLCGNTGLKKASVTTYLEKRLMVSGSVWIFLRRMMNGFIQRQVDPLASRTVPA